MCVCVCVCVCVFVTDGVMTTVVNGVLRLSIESKVSIFSY